MKLIKLLSFLVILTSCNQYFGIIEPDYIPVNETEEIFENNIITESKINISEIDEVIYPIKDILIDESNLLKIKKLLPLEANSAISVQKNLIFYSKSNILSIYNFDNPKEKSKIKLDLDQDEKIIQLISLSSNLFILTNKTKLFLIKENNAELKLNFDTFINKKIIIKGNKIIAFSVFGDALEIDLVSYTVDLNGNFILRHGVLESSGNYSYKNLISHLYNSGTLIFLNKSNLKVETSFLIEDLNILTTLGYYEELVDAPFEYQNYLYFIEKSGLVSVFNPITSNILWEIDIGKSIKDFNFTREGKLILLTNDELIIFDSIGEMIFNFKYIDNHPLKIISHKNKILILEKEGIAIVDLNSKSVENYIKNKFDGDIELITSKFNIFIKDHKNLYQISE